jgi:hypothetical protein
MLGGDGKFGSAEVLGTSIRKFRASSDSQARVKVDGTCLSLHGLFVDEIVQSTSTLRINYADIGILWEIKKGEFTAVFDQTFEALRQVSSLLSNLTDTIEEWKVLGDPEGEETVGSTREDNMTVFAKTLWAGLDEDDVVDRCREWLSKLVTVKDFAHKMLSVDTASTEEDPLELLTRYLSVLRDLDIDDLKLAAELGCVHALDRRLARSAKGYLCLVPDNAAVGDVIALLQGAKTPFILRGGEGGHMLVGECYVHGLMYGEGWDADLLGDIVLI